MKSLAASCYLPHGFSLQFLFSFWALPLCPLCRLFASGPRKLSPVKWREGAISCCSLVALVCLCAPALHLDTAWGEGDSYQKKAELSWKLHKPSFGSQWAFTQQELPGLQCSSALPPSLGSWKGDGVRWRTTRHNCPRSAVAVFHSGTSRFAEVERTKEWTDARVRKSFPCLEVSEHVGLDAYLSGRGASKWHRADAHFPELLLAWLEGSMTLKHPQNLHYSYLRVKQHGWKTFMWLSAKTL